MQFRFVWEKWQSESEGKGEREGFSKEWIRLFSFEIERLGKGGRLLCGRNINQLYSGW